MLDPVELGALFCHCGSKEAPRAIISLDRTFPHGPAWLPAATVSVCLENGHTKLIPWCSPPSSPGVFLLLLHPNSSHSMGSWKLTVQKVFRGFLHLHLQLHLELSKLDPKCRRRSYFLSAIAAGLPPHTAAVVLASAWCPPCSSWSLAHLSQGGPPGHWHCWIAADPCAWLEIRAGLPQWPVFC